MNIFVTQNNIRNFRKTSLKHFLNANDRVFHRNMLKLFCHFIYDSFSFMKSNIHWLCFEVEGPVLD